MSSLVILSALLSAVHMLTLGLGLGAVFNRGRALTRPLDDEGWRRLLAADNAWGIAAALWILSGLARVFLGGKDPTFYWRNGLFWVKPHFNQQTYQRINSIELLLIIVIVFVAAFMARGAWLF